MNLDSTIIILHFGGTNNNFYQLHCIIIINLDISTTLSCLKVGLTQTILILFYIVSPQISMMKLMQSNVLLTVIYFLNVRQFCEVMYILASDFSEKDDKYVYEAGNLCCMQEIFSLSIHIYHFFRNKSDYYYYLYSRNIKNSCLKPGFRHKIFICICVVKSRRLNGFFKNMVLNVRI